MICKKRTIVDKDGKKLGEHIWIWCPGCEAAHTVRVSSTEGLGVWDWNRDLERPTFNPSLLVTTKHGEPGKGDTACHSFIKDGEIRFLDDCYHDLKGQAVPLPDIPDWME